MFELPDLPYDYNSLEPFIDGQTMKIHHDMHHGAYVKSLNDALGGYENFLNTEVEKLLREITAIPEEIRVKVKNFAGGHHNHSLFWKWMRPSSGSNKPSPLLDKLLSENFGSVQKFQDVFSQTAMGRFGSGWAWLVIDPDKKISVIDTLNQDSPLMSGMIPILGIDVWEHAYYLKYQNRRAEYIKAWWNVVNWPEVETGLENA